MRDTIIRLAFCKIAILESLFPVLVLGMRLYMANIFFNSGLLKIKDFDMTVSLFADLYNVPLLPPNVAAIFGTAAELICPVLIVLGFGGRIGAFVLLVMTFVIQFGLGEDFQNAQHYGWMFMFGTILLYGPGTLSIDHIIRKKTKPSGEEKLTDGAEI